MWTETPALIQGSAVLGIIGLTLTWYGGMSKYAGFYDTALAWRQVFWGILIGGVAAWSPISVFPNLNTDPT